MGPMTHPLPTLFLAASELLGGDDLIVWLLLAFGGALAVGNLGAVLRPRVETRDGELDRAPVGRSVAMGVVGLLIAAWAIASLISAF